HPLQVKGSASPKFRVRMRLLIIPDRGREFLSVRRGGLVRDLQKHSGGPDLFEARQGQAFVDERLAPGPAKRENLGVDRPNLSWRKKAPGDQLQPYDRADDEPGDAIHGVRECTTARE